MYYYAYQYQSPKYNPGSLSAVFCLLAHSTLPCVSWYSYQYTTATLGSAGNQTLFEILLEKVFSCLNIPNHATPSQYLYTRKRSR